GKDCPITYGELIKDRPIFAFDKVRYYKEAIGGVVAKTEELALIAVDKIKVTYNPLPVIIDPKDALEEKDVIIREVPPSSEVVYNPIEGTNIFHHVVIKKGNTKEAFKEAGLVVENEFRIGSMNHVQIEPHGAIALWELDGTLTVWSSTQAPFTVRATLAEIFELPINKVRVIAYYVGGGFGGKSDVGIEPMVALLAKHTPGHPVKVILSREEVFHGTFLRGNFWGKVKTAVTKEGKIMAEEVVLPWDLVVVVSLEERL
ncbi:MAG TPA: xanthine dehydrogenase family protein molybdopterin-binding subunit, partial [Candidatus Atribacteria bacterium]|nr:xanthine dehydrogenase family protein molybdopterin-binding subunit [Candidatus Atribacteria bacterium]